MGLGPQFKILIGLIQVAIMVELAIQIKLSARVISPREAVKKIKQVRVGFKLAAAFASALGIFDVYNTVRMDPVIFSEYKKWHDIVRNTVFPLQMVLVSISLATAYCYLSVNIRQHFARELQDEGKKIRAIFVLFSVSYISRGVVYLLGEFHVIKHEMAVFYVMYFFWDVLPLSSIMTYHLKSFRAEEKARERPVTDWACESLPSTDLEAQSEATSEAQEIPSFKPTASF